MTRAAFLYKASLAKLRQAAFAPVSNASLVFFRISFGLLMLSELYFYFKSGLIYVQWLEPRLLFTYHGFSWVKPLPGNGLYLLWGALALPALFLATGFLYRVGATLFCLGMTYFFLLDQAAYLNHHYLICLYSFLLIFVPAHRAWAVDPHLGLTKPSATAPAWALWILRLQIAVVYFYGGLAKLSFDWLHGEPMRTWIAGRTELPILGRFIDEPWMPYFISYGGLLLDLLIVPLLLWRRTRLFAFAVAVLFHFWNARMFNIGVFPYLAVAATTLFLSPDWPLRVWARVRGLGAPVSQVETPADAPAPRRQQAVLALVGCYALIQVLVPLRHYLYPGDVAWTCEGHRFSWRMRLTATVGRALFYVTDPNSRTESVVHPHEVMRPSRARKMVVQPDMILQFAHFLSRVMPQHGLRPLQVEARVYCSLNGRKPALLINPIVDLAAERRTLGHASWLMPLNEPLPDPAMSSSRRKQSKKDNEADASSDSIE